MSVPTLRASQPARNVLSFLIRPLYDVVFPRVCFSCDRLLSHEEYKVCASCWSRIRTASPDDSLYQSMWNRLVHEGPCADLVTLFHFEKDGVLQDLIHHLKYNGVTTIGREFGRRLGERVLPLLAEKEFHGIIPIPLHPAKHRERGYNQSEWISRGMHQVTGLPVRAHILRRRKYTRSQTRLSREERHENVGDAFDLNPSYATFVRDKSFLIVDDVITTGATVTSCARQMSSGGAMSVVACSVAIAE